jgi:hypothetical protein
MWHYFVWWYGLMWVIVGMRPKVFITCVYMLLSLCMPALIYLIFSACHVTIDVYKADYNSAFIKMVVGIVFTFLLNTLCNNGMSLVSWIVVFVPFMLMTAIAAVLLFVFGLNPATGKAVYTTSTSTTTTSTTPTTTTSTTPTSTTTTPTPSTTTSSTPSTTTESQPPPFPVQVGIEGFAPFYGNLGNSKRPVNSNFTTAKDVNVHN